MKKIVFQGLLCSFVGLLLRLVRITKQVLMRVTKPSLRLFSEKLSIRMLSLRLLVLSLQDISGASIRLL